MRWRGGEGADGTPGTVTTRTGSPDLPVVGGIGGEANIALPGGDRQGIVMNLHDYRVGKSKDVRYQ